MNNELNDYVLSGDLNHAVFALSQGNPGAVVFILNMYKSSVQIDPRAWGKELHPIMELNELGIRGAQIHAFAKHTCDHDLVTAFAMFRAVQLGFITRDSLLNAIRDEKPVERCAELVELVKQRLPEFGHYPTAVTPSTTH